MTQFKPVIIESPYAGDIEANIEYARKCMLDCFSRNEAPFASHLLYTQGGVLDDSNPAERQLGISAGFAFKNLKGVKTVFYTDKGWSDGMVQARIYCQMFGLPYEIRTLQTELDE